MFSFQKHQFNVILTQSIGVSRMLYVKYLFVIALTMLMSCQHTPDKVTEPVTAQTIEYVSLDQKLSSELKPIWSQYYINEFNETKSVDILYVTNRNLKSQNIDCTNDTLGISTDTSVHYGLCRINVPKNHTTGQINFSSDARQSSHENFKILSAKSFDQVTLVNALMQSKKTPLVFVHGFNVRFQEAVLRAAQITYDLKYQGPVVLLSWPAGAGDGFFDEKLVNNTYKLNLKSAGESIDTFESFFQQLAEHKIKFNLYVHSMGHQIVLPALTNWCKKQNECHDHLGLVNELILNAPDFEERKFKDLAPLLNQTANRVTLYCSYNDNALVASETYNKNKRIGSCSYVDNVDVINVSELDAPTLGLGLGHGYYSSRPILSDVFQVLLGIDAEKRLFIRKSEPNSTEKYIMKP